jgi:ATP-dependent DNA helicase 2 subunit 2
MHSEPQEALQPKSTFNPVLQHFWQCVHARALNPGQPLPQLDPMIAQCAAARLASAAALLTAATR